MSALRVIVMYMIAHGLGLTNGLLVMVEPPAWPYLPCGQDQFLAGDVPVITVHGRVLGNSVNSADGGITARSDGAGSEEGRGRRNLVQRVDGGVTARTNETGSSEADGRVEIGLRRPDELRRTLIDIAR